MSTVQVEQLSKKYGQHTVVDRINLDIADGEFLTLLGPSGCGKTTTLRCIAGLEDPESGRIIIDGQPVVDDKVRVPPNRRNAGMVFQSYALWPHMTVFSNVAYPLRMRREKSAAIRQRVAEALEVVGLSHLAARSVGAMSGGQQQRVALARAFVAHPGLLLFDEPLSNLDAKLRGTMRHELRQLHERIGTTSIYVTHDQVEALTMSDRMAIMYDGTIQQLGTPHEVYSAPANDFVADFLGYENILEGSYLGESQGRGVVEIPGLGVLHCAPAKTTPASKEIKVAIRATAVKIHPQHIEPDNSFLADPINAVFLGDQVEHLVKAGENQIKIRTDATDFGTLRQESKLSIEFPANSLILLAQR